MMETLDVIYQVLIKIWKTAFVNKPPAAHLVPLSFHTQPKQAAPLLYLLFCG